MADIGKRRSRDCRMKETEIIFLEAGNPSGGTGDEKRKKRRRRTGSILRHVQTLCCFLLVCAFVGGVLYGKKPGVAIVAGFLAVQIPLWTFLRTKASGKTTLKRADVGFGGKQGLHAGICLAAAFLATMAVVLFRPAYFYDAVYRAEGHAYVMLRNLWKNEETWTAWDAVGRGNHHRTGEVQLEVRISELPTEPVYLRGFSGGDYVGNGWEEADEGELFGEIAKVLDWEEWTDMIGGMYHTMFFVVNQDSVRDNPPTVRELHIRHRNGDYRRVYVPYYGMSRWLWRGRGEVREEGYECVYFEQKDMDIDWMSQPSALGVARDWYHQLQKACMETVPEAYTQVPEELLPRLTEQAAGNPRGNLEEITAFIAYTLQSRASYTLTPGWAPVNQDIVEYFLFENGQGYCQHFAAAATLLYRLYGIPARYASGYLVQPADFQEQDGVWTAEVTDEAAHAWVEIFLEDYGWTPVEMTPDTEGQIPAVHPGLDSAALKNLAESFRHSESIGESVSRGQGGTKEQGDAEEGYSVLFDVKKYRELYLAAGTCLVCFLLFLPVLMDYRRLRRRQQDIVKRAVYSDWEPDPESRQLVRWVYFLMVESVAARLKGCRRLAFRYLKRYG